MITPDFLNKIVEGIENKYSELNNDMTKRIARKVASVFSDAPKTQKELDKRLYKEPVYEDINKAIHQHTDGINKEIKKAYLESANEISNHNTEIANQIADKHSIKIPEYPQKTTKASEMNLTSNEIERVEKAYKRGQRTASNLTGTLPTAGQDAYIECCNNAFKRVQAGQSMDEALTKAIDEMAQKGVTFVDYDSGRRDRVEVAVARSVRTGINQMNADLVLERCAEMGVPCVQVSQHLGARVTGKGDYTDHSKWQGKVYKVNWSDPVFAEKGYTPELSSEDSSFSWLENIRNIFIKKKEYDYPDFVETCGYGKIQGIVGANCRHTFKAFVPEVNQEEEPLNEIENEKVYNQEQKVRELERRIRRSKTSIDAMENCGMESEELTQTINLRKQLLEKQNKALDYAKNELKVVSENWRTEIVKLKYENDFKFVQNNWHGLSDNEVRIWYNEKDRRISGLINTNLNIKEQAYQCFEMRNQYRTMARDLMHNQVARKRLDAEHPNITFEKLIKHKLDKGIKEEDIYLDIIRTSMTANKEVNGRYGVK